MRYTFHLLGLAHVPTCKEVYSCAYTQKIVNLAKMLTELGHKVYFYGTEGSSVPNVETIIVGSEKTRKRVYGDYNWKTDFFKHDGKDGAYTEFNDNAVVEINLRKSERDFLLCPMGNYNKSVAEGTGVMAVESGVGYYGIFANYHVFESYAWMHYLYGKLGAMQGSWYDTIIPNYYDMRDFPYSYATPADKDNYYLFVGRLIKLKGLKIACEVTKSIGAKLIVAGQGSMKDVEGDDYSEFDNVEHVGSVDPKTRFELMSRARAVFVPTCYVGPFEGVAVEAQLCGTPVITTDWGVFNETVNQGVTGWRCRTFREFVAAAINWHQLDPNTCRNWAVSRYSTDVVRMLYQQYFDRLYDLWDEGWYQL